MSYLWIFLFASLAIGAKAQEFDLADALDLDDDVPTKAPVPKVPDKPKKSGGDELDLFDALSPDTEDPAKPPEDPKAPAGDGFDLYDALGPDPTPKKPAVDPPKDGGTGGGSFGDSDLLDVLGGGDEYKPDKSKGGGYIHDPSSDHNGDMGGDEGHAEAGSMNMTGILSAVGVAIVGAVSSYFAYQKRQLCFRLRGGNQMNANQGRYGARSGHPGTRAGQRSGGGVLSNLLRMV
ncbi:hypothetical protein AAFF_G00287710 [Aldrovandia affinis]|uniref:CD99 antigen-like protein 2 n=1 Tax=Aldrovandia affinis TaxID=143900 RepID=A0AAD7SR53_9TELE|nr:hypothetical protein AAFF_G00287710 [Aldrovandia affinis]